ncbi:glycosyltransferase [Methanoplanus limicola]|uniref:Glycosyl transferase family 2 n=1 Tax=Methanoplanus limicola DSM 2279 TaxID=937775 RepID=H1YXC5_9EURY|nr:glycosyltransferase [Methanoplanus limicola]EHQ36862.1 glycosyl transferase family 2 [Methanoplanus limicola DSM 2279]
MAPKVSVIIPVYNGQQYIGKTIESVINQSFKEWEIIVVNDGSTDRSSDILHDYILKLGNKIRVYNTANGGVSNARNLGIKLSESDYISFLDQDDCFEKTKLEKQCSFLIKNPDVCLVYSNYSIIDNNDNITKNKIFEDSALKKGFIFDDLLYFNFIGISTVMVRRSVMNRVGGFNSDYRLCEDLELLLRISKICQIDYINESLLYYRDHYQSFTYKKIDQMIAELWNIHSFWRNKGENIFLKHPLRVLVLYLKMFNLKLKSLIHKG